MTIYAAIIGTGFAAGKRVEALRHIPEIRLTKIVSRDVERAQRFGEAHQVDIVPQVKDLWREATLDLVFICTVNADHGALVQQALEHNKHVVVEYPLALDVRQAAQLVELARQRQRLLHVEHIELIGGLHLAMQEHMAAIGVPHYVNYRTLAPKQPAPKKWNYCTDLLGFPMMAALSRIQRLTNLLGPVKTVMCQGGIQPPDAEFFRTCLYSAQLQFCNGALAELTYGKGEGLWQRNRYIEIRGDRGCLVFDGNQGCLTTSQGAHPVSAAPRQGLFHKDTQWVAEHLVTGKPLYISPEESLYSLRVAAALQQSVNLGKKVSVEQSSID
ncbi:MAG: Gfo/Idh/MocA family oxidoreductase [Cyanobacteria bacterium P01_D01_bin.56]